MPRTLTRKEVIEIKAILSTREETQEEVATLFNVSQAQISRIANNRSWRHVPWPLTHTKEQARFTAQAPEILDEATGSSLTEQLLGEQGARLLEHLKEVNTRGETPLLSDEYRASEDERLLSALTNLEDDEE